MIQPFWGILSVLVQQYRLGGSVVAVNCQSVQEHCKCHLATPLGPPALACPRSCNSCASPKRPHELALADVKHARERLMQDTAALRKARGIIETDCLVVAKACGCSPGSGVSGRGSSVCVSGCKVCLGKHGFRYNVHELHAPAPTLDADNVAHVHLEDAVEMIKKAKAAAAQAECHENKLFSVWTSCKENTRCARFRYKHLTLCRNHAGPVHRDPFHVRVLQQNTCPPKLCA
jgi:hypothetical protein